MRPGDAPSARTEDGLVVALRALDASAPCLGAWRRLGRRALVDNLFYEPDFALAAAGAFGSGVQVLTVSDRAPEAPDARLLALWPCRTMPRRWGLPVPVLMGWTHGFSVLGVPLLDADDPARALDALLGAPRRLGLPPRLLMPYLPTSGPFAELLDRWLAGAGVRGARYWEHARAMLDLDGLGPAERADYLGHLSAHRRSKLARLGRRIAAGGAVAHETIRAAAGLGAALDDFLALEAAGWKGRAGTAVLARPAETAFLRALVAGLGAQDRVRIDRLRRGERTLAASIALETGTTLWYLKIAHDEAEARNSPGAQLVLHVTRSLLAQARVARADSCAPPNFPLTETLWRERLPLAHTLIEAPGGDPLFPLAVRLERIRARVARIRARRHAPRAAA